MAFQLSNKYEAIKLTGGEREYYQKDSWFPQILLIFRSILVFVGWNYVWSRGKVNILAIQIPHDAGIIYIVREFIQS